jgi:hypothetical protein
MRKRQAVKLARKERLESYEPPGHLFTEYVDVNRDGSVLLSVWGSGMTVNPCCGRARKVLHYMRKYRRTRMGPVAVPARRRS